MENGTNLEMVFQMEASPLMMAYILAYSPATSPLDHNSMWKNSWDRSWSNQEGICNCFWPPWYWQMDPSQDLNSTNALDPPNGMFPIIERLLAMAHQTWLDIGLCTEYRWWRKNYFQHMYRDGYWHREWLWEGKGETTNQDEVMQPSWSSQHILTKLFAADRWAW